MLGTKNGLIKRTPLSAFRNIRANGLIATRLKEGDELCYVQTASAESSVLMASSMGRVCRFNLDTLTPRSRSASCIKGINLQEGAEVVGMTVLPRAAESDSSTESDSEDSQEEGPDGEDGSSQPGAFCAGEDQMCALMVTEKGIGKLVNVDAFRTSMRRGGSGFIGIRLREGDSLVKLMLVSPECGPKELIVASKKGRSLLCKSVSQVSRSLECRNDDSHPGEQHQQPATLRAGSQGKHSASIR